METQSPLPNITLAQSWIAETRLRMSRIGSNIANILTDLQFGFDDLWSRTDDEINGILAEVGIESATTILTLHYALGMALNPIQVTLADDNLAARIQCATTKPRELRVNEAGNLELVPLPPAPEPQITEPEPQPEE